MASSLMSLMPLNWLPVGLRAQTLRLLTSPLLWSEYRVELARLGLAKERRLRVSLAPQPTAEAWEAAVGTLLTAAGLRVDVNDGHYWVMPMRPGDTRPTLETLRALRDASPLARASGVSVRYRAAYPWPPSPAEAHDVSLLNMTPTPAVAPAVAPATSATSATSAAQRGEPISGPTAGPTFGWLRMSDLVDPATRTRVRALLAAKLHAHAPAPLVAAAASEGASGEPVDEPSHTTATTTATADAVETVETVETGEREAIQPC